MDFEYILTNVIGILFVIAVLTVVIGSVIGVFVVMTIRAQHVNEMYVICVENGYPDLLRTSDGYFCHKLERNTDVIIPIDMLIDEKGF